jgi:hypothetical protein
VPPYRHREQHPLHTLRFGVRHFSQHHISKVRHPHARRVKVPAIRRKRRRIVIGVTAGVVALVVLVLGISAFLALMSAKSTMVSARLVIEKDLSNKQIFLSSSGRVVLAADIRTVYNDASNASTELHDSIGLKVLGKIPYLSDQSDGMESLVGDTGTTALTASVLLQKVNALVAHSTGTTVSLDALQGLQQSIIQAHTVMEHLNRPVGDLLGPLATARRQFDRQVTRIATDLSRGDQTVGYALPFLGAAGPRTYLIAGENNAEMRDQGDVLSVGVLSTDDGTYHMSDTGSVDNIEPTESVGVPVPPGTEQVLGGYQPTLSWQSVNATADFPFSAQVMQAMYQEVQGTHVNGVIALDVPTLQSLLNLTGPVTVPNIAGVITAVNVSEVLLHEQYEQYPAVSLSGERHDNISAVTKAVVDALTNEHVDLAALASALATDVAGRHLMVWDENPRYQSTVAALGISGSIASAHADRTFHLAVENDTATKLDYFVRTTTTTHVRITPSGDAIVNTSVTVTNDTPARLGPTFQTGPDGINSFTPGQYVGRVLLWAPQGSVAPGSVAESGLELSQNQVSVLPQASQTVTFTSLLKRAVVHGRFSLRFVPQPRLVPGTLKLELSAPGWTCTGPERVDQPLATTTSLTWQLSPKG